MITLFTWPVLEEMAYDFAIESQIHSDTVSMTFFSADELFKLSQRYGENNTLVFRPASILDVIIDGLSQ
jgi:hypothetical protein